MKLETSLGCDCDFCEGKPNGAPSIPKGHPFVEVTVPIHNLEGDLLENGHCFICLGCVAKLHIVAALT